MTSAQERRMRRDLQRLIDRCMAMIGQCERMGDRLRGAPSKRPKGMAQRARELILANLTACGQWSTNEALVAMKLNGLMISYSALYTIIQAMIRDGLVETHYLRVNGVTLPTTYKVVENVHRDTG